MIRHGLVGIESVGKDWFKSSIHPKQAHFACIRNRVSSIAEEIKSKHNLYEQIIKITGLLSSWRLSRSLCFS